MTVRADDDFGAKFDVVIDRCRAAAEEILRQERNHEQRKVAESFDAIADSVGSIKQMVADAALAGSTINDPGSAVQVSVDRDTPPIAPVTVLPSYPTPETDIQMRAAGILFLTPDQKALFLMRGPGGDHPYEWGIPGGKIEDGETPEDCAVRECKEETDFVPEGKRAILTRRIRDGVDFTTFVQNVNFMYQPKLNDEHVAFCWAPIDHPPQPLHPGCMVTLARFGMNELDVAKAMRDGDLTSPQRYHNMTLFALRITGTGAAYRKKLNEYVYRNPENYLTTEFLERCNGLTVIYKHPKNNTLDSREFADRVIGSIFLPYIVGNEVWGIAKIYDEEAIRLMETQQLSTSPAVAFRPGYSVNQKMTMEDGATVLLEDDPSLLDHVAICEQGVWDKGGEPTGVSADHLRETAS